jgi:hypothetical protein
MPSNSSEKPEAKESNISPKSNVTAGFPAVARPNRKHGDEAMNM